MIYYIFNTEEEAIAVEQLIVNNVINWANSENPEALTSNGVFLKGRNAKTGNWEDSGITERWAIPEKTNDDKWVFLKPTQEKVSPIPIDIVLNNVNAQEIEYNTNSFSFE